MVGCRTALYTYARASRSLDIRLFPQRLRRFQQLGRLWRRCFDGMHTKLLKDLHPLLSLRSEQTETAKPITHRTSNCLCVIQNWRQPDAPSREMENTRRGRTSGPCEAALSLSPPGHYSCEYSLKDQVTKSGLPTAYLLLTRQV